MKEFKQALKELKDSKKWKEWKENNPKAYLSYGLLILEQNQDWKIGYCTPENNQVTSFVDDDGIKIESNEKVLQKEKKKVKKLDASKIKIDLNEAVKIAKQIKEKDFKKEVSNKTVAIIQKLEESQIWNITLTTQSFNALNIKIRTEDGKIIEKKLSPLFKFNK